MIDVGICQICGRQIKLRKPGQTRIALHGYMRPGSGFQTSSCRGAMEKPLEVSRNALRSYVGQLLSAMDAAEIYARAPVNSALVQTDVGYNRARSYPVTTECTAETFEQVKAACSLWNRWNWSLNTWEDAQKKERERRQYEARNARTYYEHQARRLDEAVKLYGE